MNIPSSAAAREQVRTALQATHGLTLFRDMLNDSTMQSVLKLLTALIAPEPDAVEIADAYSQAFRALAAIATQGETTLCLEDAWQAYLLAAIIDQQNVLSEQVERSGIASVAKTLYVQAQRDLRVLQRLFQLHADMLLHMTLAAVLPSLPSLHDAWVPWRNFTLSNAEDGTTTRDLLAQRFAASEDWTELIEPLAEHWARHGTGLFAHYRVLRWQGTSLQGVAYPDTVQLTDLIGYQREKALLTVNTERFLAGLPAHDVLLYGAPGTGKSSTVKALLNMYAERSLRLVEVRKEYIGDLPKVVAQLRGRAPHFLLFVDDLSFEEHETEYKVLKMLLEGTAEARPANVLIYATTNRQNLIRENFSDRGKPTDDVHWRDTMDEKLSLVHRFGLRVTFQAPDQNGYLAIVAALARQRSLELPEDVLQARALQWERYHAGRSGRSARQFVNELEAELQQQ